MIAARYGRPKSGSTLAVPMPDSVTHTKGETGPAGRLPGFELVDPGLADLSAGRLSDEALVVLAAAPRLRRAGVEVPDRPDVPDASGQLYERLAARLGAGAHSRHHALLRRVVSYAAAHARTG